MRVVTITEAKNGLSALIDVVQTGETVLIVDRGRPVARLDTAVSASLDDPDGRLVRLQRAGIVQASAGRPPDLTTSRPPSLRGDASALRTLMQERREGR
ncbi:MAG: type II toxin-antitoxin system Phd/YefM family antitoxin [Actinomycetota bacterium]|jgi:prevent-host-death family protein|nr:type II toxin-antitoxin system Phd/YefM family antitoxin [Actinomycetota bacterium]